MLSDLTENELMVLAFGPFDQVCYLWSVIEGRIHDFHVVGRTTGSNQSHGFFFLSSASFEEEVCAGGFGKACAVRKSNTCRS